MNDAYIIYYNILNINYIIHTLQALSKFIRINVVRFYNMSSVGNMQLILKIM